MESIECNICLESVNNKMILCKYLLDLTTTNIWRNYYDLEVQISIFINRTETLSMITIEENFMNCMKNDQWIEK